MESPTAASFRPELPTRGQGECTGRDDAKVDESILTTYMDLPLTSPAPAVQQAAAQGNQNKMG